MILMFEKKIDMHIEQKKEIVEKIINNNLTISEIPDCYKYDKEILKLERAYELRKSLHRGYDVILNCFFVEEIMKYDSEYTSEYITRFKSFEEYYNFLDGDIYENSCYKFYDFNKDLDFIKNNKIKLKNMMKNSSFVDVKLSEELSCESYISDFKDGEKNKKSYVEWINIFDKCNTYDEFISTIKRFREKHCQSDYHKLPNLTSKLNFFILNYVYKKDINRLAIVMRFFLTDSDESFGLIGFYLNSLLFVYSKDEVFSELKKYKECKAANLRFRLRQFCENFFNERITIKRELFYNRENHLYYDMMRGVDSKSGVKRVEFFRIFEDFNDFASYLNNDLSNVDLSYAVHLNLVLSDFKTNENTILPATIKTSIFYSVDKKYDGTYFSIKQYWRTENGCLIQKKEFNSRYFFDFVNYLDGDLSNADLILCDGLVNLNRVFVNQLNLFNAQLTSSVLDHFGIAYNKLNFCDSVKYDKNVEVSDNVLLDVESVDKSIFGTQKLVPLKRRKIAISNFSENDGIEISYISDIHLFHKISKAKCVTRNDIINVIRKIVNNIVTESKDILLIGGDVSAFYELFKMFVKELSIGIKRENRNVTVVFVLGNHELWEFPQLEFCDITQKYRKLIVENNMFLIQNDLLYFDKDFCANIISEEKLNNMSKSEIRSTILESRIVIFGGLGFSGYNDRYNASTGIYRKTISPSIDKQLAREWENLYDKVVPVLVDKNVIILTHNQLSDWSKGCLQKNFVYVSGHTHINEFSDDGIYRVYRDNQIGYYNNPHLKTFKINNDFDLFYDYSDGIYEISKEQYRNFYRGKNLNINFNRNGKIFMLKKRQYYCFLLKTSKENLCILNGGAIRSLHSSNIEHIYSNMDLVIEKVSRPYKKYYELQKKISSEIKKFGGSGRIHGCIVDIDFFNHVYLNPNDLKVTCYNAKDIVNKFVYPNVEILLKECNSQLYKNYESVLQSCNKDEMVLVKRHDIETFVEPIPYRNTEIYNVSRNINKLHKLNYNILNCWSEEIDYNSSKFIEE